MNRITNKLNDLKNRDEKALVCFLTAGFPMLDATIPFARAIEQGGADIIEIGMPFSDPLADGPVIQASSQQAIKNGMTLHLLLKQVKQIRKYSNIPLILMGYLNPILRYGKEKFFADANRAGVDGIILPEIPIEESINYLSLAHKHNLSDILLVSPATSVNRIQSIDKVTSGFLYCVSTTGVTGKSKIGDVEPHLKRVKRSAKNPVLVGFGIKTPEDAKRIAKYADGVIVGSALIQKILLGASQYDIRKYVSALKQVLRSNKI